MIMMMTVMKIMIIILTVMANAWKLLIYTHRNENNVGVHIITLLLVSAQQCKHHVTLKKIGQTFVRIPAFKAYQFSLNKNVKKKLCRKAR
jgi:hypothetical protein